jgi:dynein heavy chain
MLRLLVDKGGYHYIYFSVYDRKERYWKWIENTMILACSAPPGGGRNELSQRFTRHFNILC